MDREIDRLLSEMRAYCDRRGIELSYLSLRAVNDGKFVARLEGGGQCLPSTMDKVRRYMAANPPKEPEAAEAATDAADQPAKVA